MFVEHSAVHECLQDGSVTIDVDIVNSDAEVIFIGSMHSVYGHCITDNLKKLWYLRTPEARKILEAGGKIVYVSAWNSRDLPRHAMRILELTGVDVTKFERVSVPTRFRKVYVPENSMRLTKTGRQWAPAFKAEIESIKSNAQYDGKLYDKIYLTRTALKDGGDIGEKRIEKLFKERGYHVISPEKLSVDAQVALMSHCKSVVCTDGSVAHNAIFCNPDTEVVILLKADYVNGYQVMINNLVGYNLEYVSANHSILHKNHPWSGPFYLSLTSELCDFLGLGKRKDLYWFRPDWYRYLYKRLFH
jgi:capsular polysaccharide biosynthesis protein